MSKEYQDWQCWQPPDLASIDDAHDRLNKDLSDGLIPDMLSESRTLTHSDSALRGARDEDKTRFDEGYEIGYAKGFEDGCQADGENNTPIQAQDVSSEEERCTLLFSQLQEALDELNNVIPQRLAQLALRIVHSLIEDNHVLACLTQRLPEYIASLCEESVLLGEKGVQLWVSAQDFNAIHPSFVSTLTHPDVSLHVDPLMHAGDCRLTYEHGEIDAQLAARWEVICHAMRKALTS